MFRKVRQRAMHDFNINIRTMRKGVSVQEEKKKGQNMTDLVQIDADTAMLLYSKGLTHLPVLKRDGYSSDWTAAQPLYLDDIIEDLMIFVSDSERNKVLNPPKVDIEKVKEEIAMTYEPNFRIDPEDDDEDDDPDWAEEPAQVETIPDDDAVPEHERIEYAPPRVLTVKEVMKVSEKTDIKTDKEKVDELISEIQLGTIEPFKWNAREAVRLNDNGIGQRALAELYGISVPTVNKRLKEYRMKS